MDGRSILWILTVGIVLIKPPHSNAIPYRRSANSNTNMNMNSNMVESRFHRTIRPPRFWDQDLPPEYISPHDTYPRSLSAGGDSPDVEAVAAAAADATLSVTKNLAEDMSETAAAAVADAVSRIFLYPRRRPSLGRRSSNVNTNYNYNLLGSPSLTESEDREGILESDVFQSKNPSAITEDFSGNTDKRYFLVPGRDPERLKWGESRYSERERELSTGGGLVRPSRCRYQSSVCGMRRTRPVGKIELMDDPASVPIEETKNSDLLGEADGLDGDKELPDDDKEDTLLSDESLNKPSDATAPGEPTLAKRTKNKNLNENLNNLDSRRYIVQVPQRKPTRRHSTRRGRQPL